MRTDRNADRNRKKYLHAPTYKQIAAYMKKLKVSGAKFERFFGMSEATIRKIKQGKRELPVRFWHIIYEEVTPMYKLPDGSIVETLPIRTVNVAKGVAAKVTEPVTEILSDFEAKEKSPAANLLSHDRLKKLKSGSSENPEENQGQ